MQTETEDYGACDNGKRMLMALGCCEEVSSFLYLRVVI